MDLRNSYGSNSTFIRDNQRQWNGTVPKWFHGVISRKFAEELLLSKPPGYFLIRVSESRLGFTLSYRAEDRCRHFMIDVLDDGNYIIIGESTHHQSLQDLVDFHSRYPIGPFKELLIVPCVQMSEDTLEYIPPAVASSAVPKPNAFNIQPCLQEKSTSYITVVKSVIPIPLPRKKYASNMTQPNQASPINTGSTKLEMHHHSHPKLSPMLESPSATGIVFSSEESDHQDDCSNDVSKPSGKIPYRRTSVVLKQIRSMSPFQKKRSTQGGTNANVVEGTDPFGAVQQVDGGLLQEYLLPPPFAPGYYG